MGDSLVYSNPHFSHLSAMASSNMNIVKCSRCHRTGHCAKDCTLPFTRTFTKAEMRLKRQAEAAQKKAEWEAKQIAFEEKKSKWEAQQAEFAKAKEARQAKSSTNQASKQLNRVSKATWTLSSVPGAIVPAI